MQIYDTTSKKLVKLQLQKQVNIYTCGITPYDSAHLGHIFTFMTYDLLSRRLIDDGHEVRLVRNVTDVDEPIYKKAAELGMSYMELAKSETAKFQATLEKLNFLPAFKEPLASQYISEMAQAVSRLIDNGCAYRLDSDIYFDVSKVESFGSFSGLSPILQERFMSMRGGDIDRVGKKNKLDFLLWKGISDPNDLAAWDEPIGHGRPGWHIECSVMSEAILGNPFDIHGGGSDLIFPHHECEIAQSIGLGEKKLANYWMHVSPMLYIGEKMSKSLGNLVFANDLLEKYPPAVIRLGLMNYHFSDGGEWHPQFLKTASQLFNKLKLARSKIDINQAENLLKKIRDALDNNLDNHNIMHALEDVQLVNDNSQSNYLTQAQSIYDHVLWLLGISLD